MCDRPQTPELTGIADQDIEAAITFGNRAAQPVDACAICEIQRHQCGVLTVRADSIVDFLETANGACDKD
jgi:hypothetical protein